MTEQISSTPEKSTKPWMELGWWKQWKDFSWLRYCLMFWLFGKTRYWTEIHDFLWKPKINGD